MKSTPLARACVRAGCVPGGDHRMPLCISERDSGLDAILQVCGKAIGAFSSAFCTESRRRQRAPRAACPRHPVSRSGPCGAGDLLQPRSEYYYLVYVNPYTAEVLAVKDMARDFFAIVLDGHFYLWLPPQIGQPLVSVATLVFIVMLISGIVLWWPRKAKHTRQRFTIRWNAKWKRVNYDLHNALGFYAWASAVLLACTGLVWGSQWWADGW